MPIVFQYDGHELDIDDVPLSTYAEIERATGVEWYRLSANPLQFAAAGEALAKACAARLNVELPTLTPRILVDLFDMRVGENRPTEYDEGVPDPKAKGSGPATT